MNNWDSTYISPTNTTCHRPLIRCVLVLFTSPADEGAGAAGQTKRARSFLPICCRADGASVGEASPHGDRRLAGSSAEGECGRPVADHLS